MTTLDKSSRYYDIPNIIKRKLKKLCRKKARKKFKKGLDSCNPKKILSCGMHIFDRYW